MKLAALKAFLPVVLIGVGLLVLPAAVSAQPAAAPQSSKADRDYYMANYFFGQKQWLEAAEGFNKFVKDYPADKRAADAQFGNGQALYQLGKYQQAGESFQSLLDNFPNTDKRPAVLFQLGQANLNAGQLDQAVAAFNQVSQKYPSHYLAEWADAMTASCLITQKQYAKAGPLLTPLVEKYIRGKDAPAKLAERDKELTAVNPQLVGAFTSVLETAHLNLALALHGQGKYEESAKEFADFLERHPKSPLAESARFYRAQGLFYTGAFAESAEAYDQIVASKGPLAESASFDKSLALYKAGDLKKAAEAFVASARDFPKSERAGKARLYAGLCLFEAGDYEGAILQYDACIAAKPPVAPDEAKYWKGKAQLKLNRPQDAAATFAEAIQSHPESPRLADLLLVRADALLEQGKQAEAAAIYQDVAARFPKHESVARAIYNAALALYSAEQFKESAALCEKFLADYPADKLLPQVLFVAGEDQFRQADYQAAGSFYRQLLDKFPAESGPDTDKTRLRLGWALYYQKQYTAAMPPLEAIGEKADEAVKREASYLKANCLLELKSYAEAAKALETYLAAGQPAGAAGAKAAYVDDALFKLALIYLKQNDKDKAAADLERLVKEQPGSPLRVQAEFQLAELSLAAGNGDQTVAHYREVLNREPKGVLAPYAAFGMGLSYYDQGKWKEAADAFAQVGGLPNSDKLLAQAAYRQGLCFQKLEQWTVAEQAFAKLVAKYPKDPYAVSASRAIGLGQEKQKDFVKAAETFTKLIADYPESKDLDQAYYELAWCYQALDKKDEMLAAFKALADKFPTSPLVADAYYYLGEQFYAKKDYDQALDRYQSCLAAAKDDTRKANALFRIGWCYWLTGKFDAAAEKFDKLVNDFPSGELLPDALLNAGEAYLRAGKPAAAADRLGKLIDGPAGASKSFKYMAEAMLRLGETQLALGQAEKAQGHDDKAQALAQKALAMFRSIKDKFPKDDALPAVEFGIGRAQFELKQYDDAIATLTAAIDMPKVSGETAAKGQFYIAEAYYASGQYHEAVKAYVTVREMFSAFPEWVAASCFQLGKVDLELSAKSAADNPQEAQVYKGEAARQFQSVIEKFPQTKWAESARKELDKLKG